MKIQDLLEPKGLYEPEAILFLLGVKYQDLHPGMMDYISSLPNANMLSKLFITTESGKPRLVEGVFGKDTFDRYIDLLKEREIGPNGYAYNRTKFPIGVNSKEARNAFNMLILTREVDLEDLADRTLEFYSTVTYIPKLERFLTESAPILI